MRIFAFLFLLFLAACHQSETDPHQTDTGEDYFPVAVGKYRIYQVDSIIFGVSGALDTLSSQIKETIVEALYNGEDTTFRVLREWREADTENWEINTVWWIRKEFNRVIQTEENLKFIKLTFPIKESVSWEGNHFFANTIKVQIGEESLEFFKEWGYEIASIQETTINGQVFPGVVTVQEADFETAIELRKSIAQYARGVGLVYRKQEILDTQCITCTEAWAFKAEKGLILTQVLIDYN